MDDIYEELMEKIMTEHHEFIDKHERLRPIEVFNNWYEIGFHNSYFAMFASKYFKDKASKNEILWLLSKKKPMKFLYIEWLSSDGAFDGDWEALVDFIHLVYKEDVS